MFDIRGKVTLLFYVSKGAEATFQLHHPFTPGIVGMENIRFGILLNPKQFRLLQHGRRINGDGCQGTGIHLYDFRWCVISPRKDEKSVAGKCRVGKG